MENATKALLIAAAVLIAILLIAFGMKIFTSTSSSSTQAGEVAQQIDTKTTNAGEQAKTAILSLPS